MASPAPAEYSVRCKIAAASSILISILILDTAMKRIAIFLLLAALTPVWAMPRKENTRIGENGREARKAAKQHQKYVNKSARKQRKAAKRSQKAQRRAGKRSRRR